MWFDGVFDGHKTDKQFIWWILKYSVNLPFFDDPNWCRILSIHPVDSITHCWNRDVLRFSIPGLIFCWNGLWWAWWFGLRQLYWTIESWARWSKSDGRCMKIWLEVAGSTRRQCLLRCCLGRRQQVHQCLPQEGRSGAEQRKDSTNGNMLRWKFDIKMNKELKAIPLLWDAWQMLMFYPLSVRPDLCGAWKNKPYIHNM